MHLIYGAGSTNIDKQSFGGTRNITPVLRRRDQDSLIQG